MAAKKPSSLSKLLADRDAHLASLTSEAHRLEGLRRKVLPQLPEEVAPHCLGADLKEGVLTLYLDSGAWSTLLHYRQRPLLLALQGTLDQPCRSLRLKVLPEPVPGVPAKPPPKTLSQETRGLLESTAGGIEDAALAEALRRLARGRPPRP